MASLEQVGQYYPAINTQYSLDGPSVYGKPDLTTVSLLREIPEGARVLEAGAGDGRYTIPLLGQELEVIANDIDEEALATLRAKAERRHNRSVATVVFNAFEPFPLREPVDAVVNTALLYLLPEEYIRDFTEAAHAATKDRGLLIVDFVTDRKRIGIDGKEIRGEEEVQYGFDSGRQAIEHVTKGLYKVNQWKWSNVDQDLRDTVGYTMTGTKLSVIAEKQ